jgi:hypothetical protein
MILERQQEILPLSTVAFEGSQGSRRRTRSEYTGALIIYRSGIVKRIERIDFLGLRGEGLLAKILSALNSDWRISVQLSAPLPLELPEIKDLIMKHLASDQGKPEPYLELARPLDVVRPEILASESVKAIFEILNVPGPDDALDAL